jgi:hypothetical protein
MKIASFMDPAGHGKPLWVVFGSHTWPQIVCVKLLAYTVDHVLLPVGAEGPNVCVWGYSVWKRKPGFRTMGTNVFTWAKAYTLCEFYDAQDEALDRLRKLTTPTCPDCLRKNEVTYATREVTAAEAQLERARKRLADAKKAVKERPAPARTS